MKTNNKKITTNPEVSSYHVQKALNHINKYYEEYISLEEVAKEVGLNKCYFCTLFKQETGKTFSQYLNEIRIEKSKEILLNKDKSILDVALAVGFNNPNYYSMVFKQIVGLTPLKYRQKIIYMASTSDPKSIASSPHSF